MRASSPQGRFIKDDRSQRGNEPKVDTCTSISFYVETMAASTPIAILLGRLELRATYIVSPLLLFRRQTKVGTSSIQDNGSHVFNSGPAFPPNTRICLQIGCSSPCPDCLIASSNCIHPNVHCIIVIFFICSSFAYYENM